MAQHKAAENPRVVVGMDPHKRSVTIEVMAADESVFDGDRFGTDSWPMQLDHTALLFEHLLIPGCAGRGHRAFVFGM